MFGAYLKFHTFYKLLVIIISTRRLLYENVFYVSFLFRVLWFYSASIQQLIIIFYGIFRTSNIALNGKSCYCTFSAYYSANRIKLRRLLFSKFLFTYFNYLKPVDFFFINFEYSFNILIEFNS